MAINPEHTGTLHTCFTGIHPLAHRRPHVLHSMPRAWHVRAGTVLPVSHTDTRAPAARSTQGVGTREVPPVSIPYAPQPRVLTHTDPR